MPNNKSRVVDQYIISYYYYTQYIILPTINKNAKIINITEK